MLTGRSQQDILEYQERFEQFGDALYRWDAWAAAYLIGSGCSDDSFTDVRAGVIALGRDWYRRVAANPASLAEQPLVVAAARNRDYVLFDEAVGYSASYAFEKVAGDGEGFYEAWDRYRQAQPRPSRAWPPCPVTRSAAGTR